VEITYSRDERIDFVVEHTIGVLGGMVDAGGLSLREAREVREFTKAARVALDARRVDARRVEDIEPEARARGHQRARRTGLRLRGRG
jgi:hypothetical protein